MNNKEVIGVIGGSSGEVIVENLHKHYNIQTALVAGQDGESGTDVSDFVIITDLRNIDNIELFFRKNDVNKFILATGHRFAFRLAEELVKRGFITNINIDASLIAKDKIRYKDTIINKGFNTPPYIVIKNLNEANNLKLIIDKINLPCVVKSNTDIIYPQKASAENELRIAIAEVLSTGSYALIESFIDGVEVTVPVRVSNGKAKAYLVSYYNKSSKLKLKGFDAEIACNRLNKVDEKRVMECCEKLALYSGFEGVPRIDAIVIPNKEIYILEANSVTATGNSGAQTIFYENFIKSIKIRNNVDLAEIVVNTALEKFKTTTH